MKLPIQLPFKKRDEKEYYLSLLLGEEKTHATIFAETNGKIDIVGEKETHFHTLLEKLSEEELLDILDKTISSAESNLPQGYQTRKTIFGVKENWIEDTKIKKEYLDKLKKICGALGLTPIGFLVIHEAIAHLLQKEEGAPVSAILAEVSTHEVAISILRAGKLLETKRVPITESIAHTIDKTLLHFTNYEILPSRIVVFNSKHHEKLSQELISHQWSKSLPFLHVPQIKILPNTFENRSLLFGAATQMGFDVVDKYDMPLMPGTHETHTKHPTEEYEQKAVQEDNFGFVEDKDIAHAASAVNLSETKAADENAEDDTEEVIENYNQDFYESEHEPERSSHRKTSAFQQQMFHLFHQVKTKTTKFFATLPLPAAFSRVPMLRKNKGLIFVPPLIIGLLLIVFLFYIFGLKATVVLHIDPKTVEKTEQVTFSTKEATNPSENIIAAELVSATEEGSASTPATGKKEVGEKAKGTITFYNSTTKEQTINKGTTVTSANNIQFILDDTVKIASSGGASEGAKTAKGNVIAKEIGKEANLPSGTKFTVSGFSSSEVEGKNEAAFSGGSKEEITVVAKADQTKLLNQLSKQLEDKAKTKLEGSVAGGKILLPVFLSSGTDEQSFSKKVGEEATSVTLEATVSFEGATYTKSEVDNFVFDILSHDNKDLAPSKDSISYTLSDVEENGSDISAMINIKGFLLPKIDKEAIAQQLAGKSFTEAQGIITKMPQIKSADITLSPNVPFFPSLLPRMPKNIVIEVATNG